mgnify:CR=1 FL=1
MVNRLKIIRKNAGLTQADFSESLGLTRAYIGQVECGAKPLSDRSLRDICRIYGVNEDWLRTGEGEPYAPKSRNEIIAEFLNSVMEEEPESVRRRWIEAFASLPDETWRAFDSLACEYVKRKEEG